MSKNAVPPTKDALLKSYHKRLKDDINSITSNFTEIIKLCKVEDENQVNFIKDVVLRDLLNVQWLIQ